MPKKQVTASKSTKEYLRTLPATPTSAQNPADQVKAILMVSEKILNQCKALQERMTNAEINLLHRMDNLEKQVCRVMHNPNLSTWWHEPVVKALNALLILHKDPTVPQCKEAVGNALHVQDYGYTLDAFWEYIHAYVDKHCRDKRGRWSSDARKAFQKNNGLAKTTPLVQRQQVLAENYGTQVPCKNLVKIVFITEILLTQIWNILSLCYRIILKARE